MESKPSRRPRQPSRPLLVDDDTLIDRARGMVDDEEGLEPILEELWARSTRRILDRAVRMTTSLSARERWLGAEMLRNLGLPREYAFQDDVVDALMAMTTVKEDTDTLYWALRSLSDRHEPRALPAFLPHIASPEPTIRKATAAALPSCNTDDVATLNTIVDALLILACDPDDDVRDWATCGLGTSLALWEDSDRLPAADAAALTDRAVTALQARLDDSHPEVRCEALRGLAVRGHPSALAAITHELLTGDQLIGLRAAADLADVRLRPVLDVVQPEDEEQEAALATALERLDNTSG